MRRRRGLDDLDGPVALEPAQRRIERAVRDPPEEAEGLAEALLQLVAVQRLLLEQAEDGELQHDATPVVSAVRYIGAIYRESQYDAFEVIGSSRAAAAAAASVAAASPDSSQRSASASSARSAREGACLHSPPMRRHVDYALARRAVLRDLRAGRRDRTRRVRRPPRARSGRAATSATGRRRLPGLRAAAACGWSPTSTATRCATPTDAASRRHGELAKLDATHEEFSRYVVEVCVDCRWNHLQRHELHGRRHAVSASARRSRRALALRQGIAGRAAGSRACPGRRRSQHGRYDSARSVGHRARGRRPQGRRHARS